MNRGFTLVELLVVIAIIGILAATVTVSLGSAQGRGSDAALVQQISQIRNQAQLLKLSTGTFNTLCDASTNTGQLFREAFEDSDKVVNSTICISSGTVTLYNNSGVLSTGVKIVTTDKWAVSMKLRNGQYFCIDHLGAYGLQANRGIDTGPLDCDCGIPQSC